MRADPEDQLHTPDGGRRTPSPVVLVLAVVFLGLLALWFWSDGEEDEAGEQAAATADQVAAAQPDLPPAPDIPHRQEPQTPQPVAADEADSQAVDQAEPPPAAEPVLPGSDEADALLQEELTQAAVAPALQSLLPAERPLQASASWVDALARGLVPRKALTLPAHESFAVDEQGGRLVMSEAGYQRFDDLATAVAGLDSSALVETFHRLRAVYERAYEQLGLDAENFDNALIRSLDLILATPEVSGPLKLERKSVLYTYADPELESLPDLQKQLLRMGPENVRLIKQQARQLRRMLLAE